ncbi:MAG: hypothetical protein ACKVP0_07570 [Pirellulaceae bacterium]
MGLFDFFKSKTKRNAGKRVAVGGMGLPNKADITAMQIGSQRCSVLPLQCGACEEDWQDAVVPNQPQELVCPRCGATNSVTWNLTIINVG